ncbi:hypothetical protein D1007_01807 [Hordeum vulgare]|nr:hypothetical protein D1007_01807 [Hordeum vulgare]
MKLLTDGLADIDHAVCETGLTTQFLHGLDKRLDTIRVVLGDQELPFDTVLSRVVLTEESQAQRAAEQSASAFAFPDGAAAQVAAPRPVLVDRVTAAPAPAPLITPPPTAPRATRTPHNNPSDVAAAMVAAGATILLATILSALGQTGLRLMHQQHNNRFTCSSELILVHHHSMASNLMAQQLPLALAMTTVTNSSNLNHNSLPLELLCLLVLAGTITASLLLMLHKGMVLHQATVVQVELVKHL